MEFKLHVKLKYTIKNQKVRSLQCMRMNKINSYQTLISQKWKLSCLGEQKSNIGENKIINQLIKDKNERKRNIKQVEKENRKILNVNTIISLITLNVNGISIQIRSQKLPN